MGMQSLDPINPNNSEYLTNWINNKNKKVYLSLINSKQKQQINTVEIMNSDDNLYELELSLSVNMII